MQELENKLHYTFRDRSLLETALTHSSYANEHRGRGIECNERLEFLGDSILGMIVARHLYETHPDMPEGKMTRLRAELVCEKSLFQVAEELNLGAYLMLGKGEEQCGGRQRPSINADAVEAILAAVYLDGGFEPVEWIINQFVLTREESAVNTDYKTALQERIQDGSGAAPVYELVDQFGPEHDKTFVMRVTLNGSMLGEGSGRTKKEAEQRAAKTALAGLEREQ